MPLSNDTVANIAGRMAFRMTKVEREILQTIGERIKNIGKILPSDATKLMRMRDTGADRAKITLMLQKAAKVNAEEMQAIYQKAAESDMEFYSRYFAAEKDWIPYAENEELQRKVAAQAYITGGTFENISNSTVMYLGGLDRTGRFLPLQNVYDGIVDKAIQAVSMGVSDYNSQIRDTLKQLADKGLYTVKYESGLKRRADSAIRMNVIDGVREINMLCDRMVGGKFGADGVELTAHNTCAPDHLPVQGRQFSREQFERLQGYQDSTDYTGNHYDPIRRAIGQWNCRHFTRSIILGVNKPVYTEKQLEEIKAENNKKLSIDGKEYTPYEASQLMRKLETRIRQAKNEALVFGASGDKIAENAARTNASNLISKYQQIAIQANMRMKYARINVAGYK